MNFIPPNCDARSSGGGFCSPYFRWNVSVPRARPPEQFAGALVVAAGEVVGLDAELVEQSAQVRLLAVQPDDPDVGGRAGAEPRRAGEQAVVVERCRIGVGVDVFAPGPQPVD